MKEEELLNWDREKAYRLRDLSNLSKSLKAFFRRPILSWAYTSAVSLIILIVISLIYKGNLRLVLEHPILSLVIFSLTLISTRLVDMASLDYVDYSRLRLITELKKVKMGESFIMGLMEEGLLEDIPPSLDDNELKTMEKRAWNSLLRKGILSLVIILIAASLPALFLFLPTMNGK